MQQTVGYFSLATLLLGLFACGGGGGGGSQGYGAETSGAGTGSTTETSQGSTTTGTDSNNAPEFTDFPSTLRVNENQTAITTIEATDADSDSLTYSVSGTDAAALSIDASTGVLSFLTAPDYEAQSSFLAEISVSDGTASAEQAITINIVDVAEDASQAPMEINVVVASGSNGYGSGNKYYMNGGASPDITLEAGRTYRFLQSDSSNSTHAMRLSTTANGTHGGGSADVAGVEYVGSAGSSGAYLQFTVPASGAPETLYYYCVNHSGMGGRLIVSAASGGGYVVTQMN